MSTRRLVALLVAALAVIAGAMYLSSLRHMDRDGSGLVFLPGLDAQVDSITEIRLRKGSENPFATLHRQEQGHWSLAQRGHYQANLTKVRSLLLALSEAKVIEEKTSNPASYKILGVDDPSKAGASGTEVTLVSPAKTITVIVGHSAGNGNYVRRAGESPSFLVEPAVPLDTDTHDWIDGAIPGAALDKIQRVRMRLSDGSSYVIARPLAAVKNDKPGTASAPVAAAQSFKLETIPAGREAIEAAMISPSATTFSDLQADDVATDGSIDFSKPSVAELELSDGSKLIISGTVARDRHWITLQSSKDSALNAKTKGRAFEIASYRYDALFRPLEQLLKPKPTGAALVRPSSKASRQEHNRTAPTAQP